MSEWLSYLFNVIGLIGMVCILLAYFMQQQFGWKPDSLKYLLANCVGAGCLIISLLWDWNLPVFLLECIWFCISLFGLWKWWKNRARQAESP